MSSANGARGIEDLIRDRRAELGLSLRDVSGRAKAKGYSITHVSVGAYERGAERPRHDKIDALAAGLGIRPTEIRRAIRVSGPLENEHELPEYQHLNEANRSAVRELAKALLAHQREVEELSERIERTEHAADLVEQTAVEAAKNGRAEGASDEYLRNVQDFVEGLFETPEDEHRTG